MMTNVHISPRFKGHSVHKEFLSVERPSPEGAGSSSCDSHTAPWTGFTPSHPTPFTHSLLRSKLTKESLNGCGEYNSIRSIGTQRHAGHLCKKCVSYFNIFRGEAFKQIIDGNLSTKDPNLPIHLYESMKAPAGALEAWSNVDGRCSVCSTHFSQLKQEAIRTILTQDRAIWTTSSTANISSTGLGSQTLPRTSSHRPAASKPHQRSCNEAPDFWIRDRQHLEAMLQMSSCNGINSASQKTSQSPLHAQMEPEKESMTSSTLCNYNSSQPSRASSMSSLLPAGTSAAVSFFVKAVQKLNVMVRRGRQYSESGAFQNTTNFSSLLQKSSPPTPANLFLSASKSKEPPVMGKVKVMLRVCPVSASDASQPHCVKLDQRKKQITVLNVATHNTTYTQSTGTAFSPKTFTFDAAFGHDSTQAEICESSLCDLLHCVLAGADGCILSFGQTNAGMTYTMFGHDGCVQTLGVIPCAISWLFKLINRKKDKTWANISVSVTAVEVCGENNAIRDLLSDVDAGKETYKQDAYLMEDPIYGIQLCNHSVLNAPTPEIAASLLDAAIASRNSGTVNSGGTPGHRCHMFFTLHVRQQHIGGSTKSGMNVDQSKLSLVALGSCVGEKDSGVCLADLGNIIIAKLTRHKHVPNKGNKLAMLLQDCLSNINCTTTIIAHISTSSEDLTETLCTMQTASRIRRLQKRTRKSSSSSPGGGSSGNERKTYNTTRLRTFQSTGTLDQDLSSPGVFGEPGVRPGSAKSFESVIDHPGLLNKEMSDRSGEVWPIIPSSLKSKLESKKRSLMKLCDISPPLAYRMKQLSIEKDKEESAPTLLQDRSEFECLKCNTFAELQNRLGNIDIDKERRGLVGMDPCTDQDTNTVSKAPHLSQAEKSKSISIDVQASNKQKESDNTRHGSSPKRFPVIQNSEEIKSAVNSLIAQTCSPQLDAVKQCDHMIHDLSSSRSKPNIEKTEISLPLRLEDQSMQSHDSTIQPGTRISPAGKSAPRSGSSSSSSSSLSNGSGSPHTVASVNENIPHCMLKHQREMKATITVTVQQPLGLNGQDELVYSVVEEVTINGTNENGKAKILSVRDSPSLQSLTSEGRPVRIIGSVGQEHTTSFLNSGTKEQTSEIEFALESSDVTFQKKGSVQPTAVNTNVDNVRVDSKETQQCDAWSDVPLTEDIRDMAKIGPSCNHSKHYEISKSRQYDCDIITEQSAVMSNFKDAPHLHMYTEHKNPPSPRETLERKQYIMVKQRSKDNVPLPSTYKNSPNAKQNKEECRMSRSAMLNQKQSLDAENETIKAPREDSSKLFNARLKALSSRSHTLDLSTSGTPLSLPGSLEGICTSPRFKNKRETGRINIPTHSCSMDDAANFKEEFENFVIGRASQSFGRVPTFFPMHDVDANDTTQCKIVRSKASSANKSMSSSKIQRMSDSSPKNSTQSLSSKSNGYSMNRITSLSCNGLSTNQSLWSTQSLSTKSSALPLKGRIELLKSSRDSLCNSSQGGSDLDETEEHLSTKPSATTLPSPYSWITAPRKPSGHASDTTSVLSGELPPAMCKTALLYNRSSMVSSGYDSMRRESEATISSSSTHNSFSDQSCSLGAAKVARSSKKKANLGSSPRALSQDSLLTLKRSVSGPKMQWADRGRSDSYEIKVYEIDHVDSLQKRAGTGNKRMVRFSAQLKFLEHRQQRIAEVRLKYNLLKRELDHAKQHLMIDPGKWSREFDLWQTFEVDSLEHLEALEQVTERLERHVNLCKAHVLMVTCFDEKPKRKQKSRHRPPVDHKGFVAI